MIETRDYGSTGPPVYVLHGGPGAAGYLAPVARGLADRFRVVEPWQRGAGGSPLTVTRHVVDLHELIVDRETTHAPVLVGHSWGAMLALAYAAAHPGCATAVVLIGCGTFDTRARDRLLALLDERMDGDLKQRLERLAKDVPDPDARLATEGDLIQAVYNYDVDDAGAEPAVCDARAHRETWDDMLAQQAAGVYPGTFRAIRIPVLMLHGAHDPHPGTMIRDGLLPILPQLEYHEWERCGHHPWLERAVRDDFFAVLNGWLARCFDLDEGPAG